jgi:hypothetical protein
MRIPRTILSFALPLGIAAAMAFIPTGNQAEAAGKCPNWLAQYCVVSKDGLRQTVETNPCRAMKAGQRILHRGVCGGPICTWIEAPVCSIDPATHKRKTYSNLCWSDVANATLVHQGACK